MSYLEAKNLSSEDFKRLCGVRPETFQEMVQVVRSHTPPKKIESSKFLGFYRVDIGIATVGLD